MELDNHTISTGSATEMSTDMPRCAGTVASSSDISFKSYTSDLRDIDVVCPTACCSNPDHPGNRRMTQDILDRFVADWGNAGPGGRSAILQQIRDLVENERKGVFLIGGTFPDSVGIKYRRAREEEITRTLRKILDGLYKFFAIPLRPCDVLLPTGFGPNAKRLGNVMMKSSIDHIVERYGPRMDDQILIDIKSTIIGQDKNPHFLFQGYKDTGGQSYCRKADDEEIYWEIRVELRRHPHLVTRLPTDILCCTGTLNEAMLPIVKKERFAVEWGNTRPEGRDAVLVNIRNAIIQYGHRLLIPVFHDAEGTYCRRTNDEEFKTEISRIWRRYFSIPLRPVDILCPRGNYLDCNHDGNVRMRRIIFDERYNYADAGTERRREIFAQMRTRIAGPDAARFLFQGRQNGDILYCREAFPGEVEGEIASELRSYFNLTPTDKDYIFGEGNAIAQWRGNVLYREKLMDPRRAAYHEALRPAQKQAIVDEIYNAIRKNEGRFLYSWDLRPFHGLMEEDNQTRIRKRLARAVGDQRRMNQR